MAVTITNRTQDIVGSHRCIRGTVTFDSSYPTGGETFDKALLDMADIDQVQIVSQDSVLAHWVVWDRTNDTLKVYTADNTEAGNGTDQSAVSVEFQVFGK